MLPQTPHASCVVGGYSIPKGSNAFLNMDYIHTDPKIWEKPAEFRPKKFLEVPGKYDLLGNNFTYMLFGSGRRICAGLLPAERIIPYVLASLLHSFEWESPPGVELELLDKFRLVVRKMKPPEAIPKPRFSTNRALHVEIDLFKSQDSSFQFYKIKASCQYQSCFKHLLRHKAKYQGARVHV